MRALKTSDIGTASKIMKKLDIELTGESEIQVGINLVKGIMENYHKAEEEVAELMSNLIGITKDEWLNLNIEETVKYFEELKNQPGIAGFFQLLGKIG